jgi:hypothetical protein
MQVDQLFASELAREASPLAMRATNVKTFPKTFLSFLLALIANNNSETLPAGLTITNAPCRTGQRPH